MSWVISLARASSAPRKMKGKPSTLLTWLGKSERPVAMTRSLRAAMAFCGRISGLGLASANTMGFSAMLFTIAGLTRLAPDTPTNTSAPCIASARVRSVVLRAKACLKLLRSARSLCTTPLESTRVMLVFFAPIASSSFIDAIPAAPAPRQTIFAVSSALPCTCSALMRPAQMITAVPCWSSWNTGISSFLRSAASISKQCGAAMSSRLMPPKVGAMASTTLMKSCGVLALTSIS